MESKGNAELRKMWQKCVLHLIGKLQISGEVLQHIVICQRARSSSLAHPQSVAANVSWYIIKVSRMLVRTLVPIAFDFEVIHCGLLQIVSTKICYF